ncbi:MAG: DNA polymerase III subunit delta' [Myxococcales bacterium]|jgi:DNA polymerase-3 subunit delta'|nr:MAG: DNA polymerase III subunit delta' [Myxococcales bacterium]
MCDGPRRHSLTRPFGHEAIVDRLERLSTLADGQSDGSGTGIPHAIVMAGPDGVGKFKTAIWWASQLKCERRGEPSSPDRSCECPSCAQVAAGAHPDVMVVAPAAAGKVISVDDVRDGLIPVMSLKPVRAGPRLAIVRDAEMLGVPAQNAMLKLLEEPPGFGVIVLVTASLAALLPTIRSRCQTLRFGPLPDETVGRLLEAGGMDAELARAASVIARGSAGRALACDGEELEDRVELILAFERFRAGTGPSMDELVTDLVDRRKTERSELPVLLEWQLKKIETAHGCPAPVESHRLAALLEAAANEAPERLVDEAVRTQSALRRIERNANKKLALRDLLLDIRPS